MAAPVPISVTVSLMSGRSAKLQATPETSAPWPSTADRVNSGSIGGSWQVA